jgi:cytochrome c-type biogenesis protein CcsB
MDLVRNPAFLQLRREVHMAEMQDKPRKGVLAEAEALEKRLMAMQGMILTDGILPIPVQGDVKAKWGGVQGNPVAAYASLMAGPRLEGWPSAADMDREVFYNRLNPVRWSWIILLASLGVCVAGWVRRSKVLDGVAFALLLGGFGFMTWGIQLRWAVGGRIPAANMYESLLFLAWGVGLFAVIANAFIRNRVVVLNAAFMAALTMALTDLLPIDRFIHPIAPVLAGTPWLAIHVPIIMVGYAVLALGLVVAHMQVGTAIFAPRNAELPDRLYDLLYNYIFIGNILLITGIITGSVWAASSWGRYWGWDPKEVWSLVAFLAYMAILHAKLDKLIGRFGVAAVSIVAFQTILMTYLGVNFVLTTGMHSYGMGDSPVVKWMVLTALAEAAFLTWAALAHRRNQRAAR